MNENGSTLTGRRGGGVAARWARASGRYGVAIGRFLETLWYRRDCVGTWTGWPHCRTPTGRTRLPAEPSSERWLWHWLTV